MAKMKLTIIQAREWTGKQADPLTGEVPHCFFYAGFDDKSKPVEFKSSREGVKVHEGVLKYEPNLAEEFNLEAQFDSFKGRLKLREVEDD